MNDTPSESRFPARRSWVTMAEVAARAQVSKITVSRVLKSPDKVKPETRARVEEAISALGYLPNETANAFSSGQSRTIGALLSTLGGSTFESTVRGLSETLLEAGYQLLLATTDFSPEKEAEILSKLLLKRPDGLVLTSTVHTEATRALLSQASVPVVELWELPEQPLHSVVGFSNFEAGRAMTAHLIARGYRRIGFIGPPSSRDERSRRRAEGYEAEIREKLGGEPRVVVQPAASGPVERGANGLAGMLERWPDTDAIFCSSDQIALGAIAEANRRGLSTPGQIAIAGFGDFEFAGEDGLELTTVRIHGHQIGVKAAEMLVDFWQGTQDRSPRTLDLGYDIISRRTA